MAGVRRLIRRIKVIGRNLAYGEGRGRGGRVMGIGFYLCFAWKFAKKFYWGSWNFYPIFFFFLVSVVELRGRRFFFLNGREFCMAFKEHLIGGNLVYECELIGRNFTGEMFLFISFFFSSGKLHLENRSVIIVWYMMYRATIL